MVNNSSEIITKRIRLNELLEDLISFDETIDINDKLAEDYINIIIRKFYTEEEYFRTIFTHMSRKKRLNQGKKEGKGTSKFKNIKGNISAEIIYTLLERKKDSLTGYEQELFDFNLIKLNEKELKFLSMNNFREGVYSTWDIVKSHLIEKDTLILNEKIKNKAKKKKEKEFEISYNSLFTNVWHRQTKSVLGDEIYLRYLSKAQEKHQNAEERRAIGNDYIVHPFRIAYTTHKDLESLLKTTKNQKHAAIITALTHDLGESRIKEVDKKIEEITRKHLLGNIGSTEYFNIIQKLKKQKKYNSNIIEIRDMARKDFSNEFGIVLAEIISSMTKENDYKTYINNMVESVKKMNVGKNLDYLPAWYEIDKNKIDSNEIEILRKELRWIIPYVKIRDCIDNTERMVGLSKSGYSKRLMRNIEVLKSLKELLNEDSFLNSDLIKITYDYLNDLTVKEFKNYITTFKNSSNLNIRYRSRSINLIYNYLEDEKDKFKKEKIDLSKEETSNNSLLKFDNFLYNLESRLNKDVKESEKLFNQDSKELSEQYKENLSEEEIFNLKKKIISKKREELDSYIQEISSVFDNKEKEMADELVKITKLYILKSPGIEIVPVELDSRRIKDVYNAMIKINSEKVNESVSVVFMKNALENLSNYENESFEKTIEKIKQYATILRMNQKLNINSNLFNKYNNLLVDKVKEVKTHLYEEIEKGKEKFKLTIEVNKKIGYFDPIPKEDIDSLNKGIIKIEMYTENLSSLKRVA